MKKEALEMAKQAYITESQCIQEMANYFDEEMLFFDDKNNMYVIVGARGVLGYTDISVLEYSSNKIVARAAREDIDGDTGCYDEFAIFKEGNGFIIGYMKIVG